MTLQELAVQYRAQAEVLRTRIGELTQAMKGEEDPRLAAQLEYRLRYLNDMWKEARDIAVVLERYYERGYRRNGRYTL